MGVAYNVQRKGAKGVEAIPHLEMWKDLPFLVRDGVVFATTRPGPSWPRAVASARSLAAIRRIATPRSSSSRRFLNVSSRCAFHPPPHRAAAARVNSSTSRARARRSAAAAACSLERAVSVAEEVAL